MEDLITENQNIKVVYDTNDNNRVIGLLDASVDSAAHEASCRARADAGYASGMGMI